MPNPQPVISVIQPFIDAGIAPPNCRRLLIDLTAGDAVRVYYEVFGDERLVNIMGLLINDDKLPKMGTHDA